MLTIQKATIKMISVPMGDAIFILAHMVAIKNATIGNTILVHDPLDVDVVAVFQVHRTFLVDQG